MYVNPSNINLQAVVKSNCVPYIYPFPLIKIMLPHFNLHFLKKYAISFALVVKIYYISRQPLKKEKISSLEKHIKPADYGMVQLENQLLQYKIDSNL